MSAAQEFRDAVFVLINRNQDYVNRKGVNAYSRETDKLINVLIRYYNMVNAEDPDLELAEKDYFISGLLDEIERLKTILKLFNINPGLFTGMSHAFLKKKLDQVERDEALPVVPPAFFMDIEIDFLSFQTDQSSAFNLVRGYRFAKTQNIKKLVEHFRDPAFGHLHKYMDIIDNYPEIDETFLFNVIERDYLDGSLKPGTHKEAVQNRGRRSIRETGRATQFLHSPQGPGK